MSKIIIDGRMLGWTGIGIYTRNLIENLQDIDHENEYLILTQEADRKKVELVQPNFQLIQSNIAPYSVSEQVRLTRQLRALKPDLVHFVSPNIPTLYRGKFITTIHDLTLLDHKNIRGSKLAYSVKQTAFRYAFATAAKRSMVVITATEYVRHQVIDRFHQNPHKVIAIAEAATPLKGVSTEYSYLLNRKYILCVGNAYPYKNLKRLIDAFHELHDPTIVLVLVGKTDLFFQQMQAYVSNNHIKYVHFTGFVSEQQLHWLYQHAALYVFPSLSEGFGLPGLEAMQYGLPVVASSATCLPEVYGDAAVYFDPNNTADMARVINSVLNDPKISGELKKKGLARVKQFSWRRMAEETLTVYESALKNS